jgi:hypothetical protein
VLIASLVRLQAVDRRAYFCMFRLSSVRSAPSGRSEGGPLVSVFLDFGVEDFAIVSIVWEVSESIRQTCQSSRSEDSKLRLLL